MPNFVNGIQLGAESSGSAYGYAYGHRHLRRVLRWWLTKVIGYQDIEAYGSAYNTTLLATLADGATHATNPSRFSSATGGFASSMEGHLLIVHPTDATVATTGGFTDPDRNGLYKIKRVYDSNNLDVEIFNGVHTDGLPLGESGLAFTIIPASGAAADRIPVTGDHYVVRGTGIGGDFDVYLRENTGNYGPTRVQVSPWADWVAGSPGGWNPSTRVTSETYNVHSSSADLCWFWAVGDKTRFIVWARTFNTSWTAASSLVLYVGDITAFHPTVDTRPVVLAQGLLDGSLQDFSAISAPRMVAPDDTTQVTGEALYLSTYPGSGTSVINDERLLRSEYSGRFVRTPILVAASSSGNEEVRGQYKGLELGHHFGPRGPTPLGTNRDRIRFFTQLVAPWNGSKIYRYVY